MAQQAGLPGRMHRLQWVAVLVMTCVVAVLLTSDVVTLARSDAGSSGDSSYWFELTVSVLAYGGLGTFLTLRAPTSRMGPLLLAVGCAGAAQAMTGTLAPSGQAAAATDRWLLGAAEAFQFLGVGGVVVLLLVAPTGRPLSGRWQVLVVASVVGLVATALHTLLFRDGEDAVLSDQGLGRALSAVLGAVGLLFLAGAVAVPICLLLRWYRARGLERQQVGWVVIGGLAGPALVVLASVVSAQGLNPTEGVDQWLHGSVVWGLAGAALPAGISVAVLRHRMYDIERVVSRTTAYLLVSGVVVVVYVVVVTVTSRLLPSSSSLTVALATLAAAAVFRPALVRVRDLVDRRFDRSRYDSHRTADEFARRLRAEVDADVIVDDLLHVVATTLAPASSGVWVSRTPGTAVDGFRSQSGRPTESRPPS
ncbi:MAG: hypothetical protein OEV62_02525 [Actinomycetota bacterium]|nr:hypothetical protein [Actinomycetota bacterium]